MPDKQSKDAFKKVCKDSEVTTKESDTKKPQIPDNEERSEAFQKWSDEGCEMSPGPDMDSAGLVTYKFYSFCIFS